MLCEFFSICDEVLDGLKLYKIETIGDAYICAANFNTPDTNHTVSAVTMGMAMLQASRLVMQPGKNEHIKIRVGIHTGPVSSGIVGKKRKLVTMIGDTMNLASRMEQSARPETMRISEAVYKTLPPGIQSLFKEELVVLKGVGKATSYYYNPTEQPSTSTS